jgi:Fis family transcriptional regulator, factor for inversion stimulation protein
VSPAALHDLLDRLITEMIRGGITLDEGRQAFESRFIERTLAGANGHLGHAADQLGVHRNTLSRKMAEYKLRAKR